MCAYDAFHHQQQTAQASDLQQQNIAIPTMIESLVKKFKTHRCALGFDHGFVKATIREEGGRRGDNIDSSSINIASSVKHS